MEKEMANNAAPLALGNTPAILTEDLVMAWSPCAVRINVHEKVQLFHERGPSWTSFALDAHSAQEFDKVLRSPASSLVQTLLRLNGIYKVVVERTPLGRTLLVILSKSYIGSVQYDVIQRLVSELFDGVDKVSARYVPYAIFGDASFDLPMYPKGVLPSENVGFGSCDSFEVPLK